MKTTNKLLKHLIPVIQQNEKSRAVMIKKFKQFIKNTDIDEINRFSSRLYEDGTDYFFSDYPYKPSERDMHVIASFLQWLGTNCGQALLHRFNKEFSDIKDLEKRYIIIWALDNNRRSGLNGGYTILEHILTPINWRDDNGDINCPANKFVTVYDIETINFMVKWLASNDGQTYLKSTIKPYKKWRKIERDNAFNHKPQNKNNEDSLDFLLDYNHLISYSCDSITQAEEYASSQKFSPSEIEKTYLIEKYGDFYSIYPMTKSFTFNKPPLYTLANFGEPLGKDQPVLKLILEKCYLFIESQQVSVKQFNILRLTEN